MLERRGCYTGCLVCRAISKKTGAAVALKHIALGIPPRPASPVVTPTLVMSQQTGTAPRTADDSRLTDQTVVRFIEAYVLANIDHECIVRLSGVVRDTPSRGTAFYIEMPFHEYDLDWAIRERLVGALQAADITKQLLRAVAYLHSRGIAHRDICPANVLLRSPIEPDPRSPRCHVVLAGFGQTCQCPYSSRPPQVVGAYHAPECFALTSDLGAVDWTAIDWSAVDMWAVGCVLGELLLGRPLFSVSALRRLSQPGNVPAAVEDPTAPITRFACATGFAGLSELLPSAPQHSVELLQLLLHRDPRRRVVASSALHSKFISPTGDLASPQPPVSPSLSQRKRLLMDSDAIRQFLHDHWRDLLL